MTNTNLTKLGQISIDDDGNYFLDGDPVGDETSLVTRMNQLIKDREALATAEALHRTMCHYGENCEICTAWTKDEKKAAVDDLKFRIRDVRHIMRTFVNDYDIKNQPGDASIDRILMLVAQRMNGEKMTGFDN